MNPYRESTKRPPRSYGDILEHCEFASQAGATRFLVTPEEFSIAMEAMSASVMYVPPSDSPSVMRRFPKHDVGGVTGLSIRCTGGDVRLEVE